jgi:hypothetical protein
MRGVASVSSSLGLSEHHDLEELLVLGLEVAQEPDLFQGLDGHPLGLLDEGHDPHVMGVSLDQIILKDVQDLEPAVRCRGRQFQLEGDGVQDVLGCQAGIREIDDLGVFRQFPRQHPAHHGLAAPHLADDLDDAFAARDGVHQRFQHRAAVAPRKEQTRVGRDLERRLRQPEIAEIHLNPVNQRAARSCCTAWAIDPEQARGLAHGLDNQRVIVDQQELRLGGRVRIGAPSGVAFHHTLAGSNGVRLVRSYAAETATRLRASAAPIPRLRQIAIEASAWFMV